MVSVTRAGAWIDYTAKSNPDFVIADGDAPTAVVEYFAPIGGGIEIDTDRTVVVRSVQCPRISHRGRGSLFLEDVTTEDLRFKKDQHVRSPTTDSVARHLRDSIGSRSKIRLAV